MYLLTTFKRKFEKMGYVQPSIGKPFKADKVTKQDLANLRSGIRRNPNPIDIQDLRQITGGVASKSPTKSLKERLKIYKNSKPKVKLLTGKRLAIGVGVLATTGLGIAAINKLRKSRNDKGKLRGKYNK